MRTRTKVCSVSAALLVAAGASGAAAVNAAPSPDGYAVGVSSSTPLADTTKASSLPNATPEITPKTDTPDGFKLQHPGHRRSDYVYDSDNVYQGSYHCVDGECTLLGEVRVQLHEVAI